MKLLIGLTLISLLSTRTYFLGAKLPGTGSEKLNNDIYSLCDSTETVDDSIALNGKVELDDENPFNWSFSQRRRWPS